MHHTDRGSRYASHECRLLDEHGLRCSMSAAGSCYDKAVVESFFATLKKELVHGCAFETRSEAYDAISHASRTITTRNGGGSRAGNQSSIDFELAHSAQPGA